SVSGIVPGTSGWTFKPNGSIAIGQLGAFSRIIADQGEVTVGVWSSGGTLLRSATVNSGGELRENSYFSTIDPLFLVPLQTYHVGVYSSSGSIFMDIYDPLAAPGDTISLSPLMILGGLASSPTGFSFPAAENQGDGAMYLGPNLVFLPIPEPGSMALIGLAAGCFLFFRRGIRPQ
ncbi:MAG TPA: PEP-CTERM sorting domain-containing protein, partial [Clostridia bacterium]|nr:PEP-CTERM sorting domain-containing protein [Clostridia bacterium]